MRRVLFFALVPVFALSLTAMADPVLSVHFLDVGWGSAVLIDYGIFEALIDGGSDATCSAYIEPYLDGFLEVLIATHPDAERIGGLDEVLGTYDVASVFMNGVTADTDAYRRFADAVDEEGSYVKTVRAGDSIALADLRLDVLHPGVRSPDASADALVLRLSYRDWDFLFPSAIDSSVEEHLLAEGLGTIDILQVARYGAGDATSPAFLRSIRPVACILSVGPNPEGSPSEEVLDRIGCAPSEPIVFRTDIHGTIVLDVAESGEVLYRTSTAEDPHRYPCPSAEGEPRCGCRGGDRLNCEDFACQPAAQACFEHCIGLTGLDVHGLDHDQDGIACEELPEICR